MTDNNEDNIDLFKTDEEDAQNIDPNKNPFEELVGEGKKFSSKEDLAKGKLESDNFIKQLQKELSGLRGELQGRMSLEQFIDKLDKKTSTTVNNQVIPKPDENQRPDNTSNQPVSSITKEDIENLLVERERAATEKTNLKFVAEQLKKSFGDNFQSIVNNKAKELDIGQKYLESIAKERPHAFLKLMGADKAETIVEKTDFASFLPKASVNAQAFKTNTSGLPKTNTEYKKLLRTDPVKYWSKEVQTEMFKLTSQYGDDFLNS